MLYWKSKRIIEIFSTHLFWVRKLPHYETKMIGDTKWWNFFSHYLVGREMKRSYAYSIIKGINPRWLGNATVCILDWNSKWRILQQEYQLAVWEAFRIYTFDESHKYAVDEWPEWEDFPKNGVEYFKVGNTDEVKEDLLERKFHYMEDRYGIMLKSKCKISNCFEQESTSWSTWVGILAQAIKTAVEHQVLIGLIVTTTKRMESVWCKTTTIFSAW